MFDKIKGALFGVAIGDALGATTEFMSKEEIQIKYGKVTELVGGGPWGLEPGQVTDDTEMTLAVIKGIMSNSINPIEEIGKQFLYWIDSNPVDIGIIIGTVLDLYKDDWFQAAEIAHHRLNGNSAGNGSLMRCLPIALAYSNSKKIEELTYQQSKMTHHDELASEACVIYNRIAKRVLHGEDLKTAIRFEIKQTRYDGSYEKEPDCPPDGFVVHSMYWVLYWLINCETFEDVITNAANKGNDSDTIAAIAGGLKGLEVGFLKLPVRYTSNLLCRKSLEAFAHILFLIRDQDTTVVKNHLDKVLKDLENQVNKLKDLISIGSSQKEKDNLLDDIKKNIYLFRLSFDEGFSDYDQKLLTWRMTENRYNRTRRLIDLGAPEIVIFNEIRWLETMVQHMQKRYVGIDPQFTENELAEMELELELDN